MILPMTNKPEGPGNRPLSGGEMYSAFGPRRAWSRAVEVRLAEEEVEALAVFISEEHGGKIQEAEAIQLLLRDELVRLGLLRSSRS